MVGTTLWLLMPAKKLAEPIEGATARQKGADGSALRTAEHMFSDSRSTTPRISPFRSRA